jgi:hypothetical protein
LKNGGSFILRATATDGEGRTTTTELDFYALGEGYTAWRPDQVAVGTGDRAHHHRT